ncbi:GntR family transcriptional regulator [Caldicellulosiruptoraceae bacterium PP1]
MLNFPHSTYPPRYEIVLEKIKKFIENDIYKEGDKLPSEIELSRQLGVSRATLREALRILEDEGYIIRRHGIGTFIAPKPILKTGMEELISITTIIEKQGLKAGTKDIVISKGLPNEKEAFMLKLKPNEEIIKVERVRLADNQPIVYCLDRLPAKLFTKGFNFNIESLFKYLNDVLGIYISYAVSDIVPMKAETNNIYRKLNIDKNDVLLLLDQLHFDTNDNPILYSSNYFSPKKFRFFIVRKRI